VTAVSLEPDPAGGLSAKRARSLLDAVLGRGGRTDSSRRMAALRHGAAAAGAVPEADVEELGASDALVEKVARHAYRITAEDVAELREAAVSEDEIFDLVVSTAVGAGMARRAIGLAAVDRWEERR
jgi:alkylhydroperoxidase family enzyme